MYIGSYIRIMRRYNDNNKYNDKYIDKPRTNYKYYNDNKYYDDHYHYNNMATIR